METQGLIMISSKAQHLPIIRHRDEQVAQKTARQLALSLGFASASSEEIVLVVTELVTNLLKHAHGGTLIFTPLHGKGRAGLQIEAQDEGPGITDVNRALTDGYSTAGSPGFGLGTVNRLMDKLDIVSEPGGCTHVTCHRWIRSKTSPLPLSLGRLDFGAATRPCLNSTENGDAFIINRWNGTTLAGIIDGLGHGQWAQRAAHTARQYIETHYDQPLGDLFQGAGCACRSTRGVVMALARFESNTKLTFASIGNVEAYIWDGAKRTSLRAQRGILGTNIPEIQIIECPWKSTHLLVLHSDGIRNHWPWDEFSSLAHSTAQNIAWRLLCEFARKEDDATVVTVKG
jgi:anti-sigma regulatory factor (Ser/Thr protein kinase)